MNLRIATAKFNFSDVYYFENHRNDWAIDIIFNDPSVKAFKNIIGISLGKDILPANYYLTYLQHIFKEAGIYDNTNPNMKVSVLFTKKGNVIAIGAIGKDVWIDVRKKFKKVTFKKLNLSIDSLTVY